MAAEAMSFESETEAQPAAAASVGQRSRRKSAKAAAAFVSAAMKEELAFRDVPAGSHANKRSHSRGSGSSVSCASSASNSYAKESDVKGSAAATATTSSSSSSSSTGSSNMCKKKTALSTFAVEYLKAWMMSPDHIEHPYPTEDEKLRIMSETGIELKQLTNWFVNNRKRYWKPRVEEMRRRVLEEGDGRTLQELAAEVQNGGSEGEEDGGGAAKSLAQVALRNSKALGAGGGPPFEEIATSECEEEPPRVVAATPESAEKKKRAAVASSEAGRAKPSASKRRKKHSAPVGEGPPPSPSAAPGPAARAGKVLVTPATPRSAPGGAVDVSAVADPMAIAAPPLAPPPLPVSSFKSVHVASSHASVKVIRKMSHDSSASSSIVERVSSSSSKRKNSRVVSETSSSESELDEYFHAANNNNDRAKTTVVVSPLLLSTELTLPPPVEYDDDPVIRAAAAVETLPPSVSVRPLKLPKATSTQIQSSTSLDMEFSITPLDGEVTSAAAGFCCGFIPHGCGSAADSKARSVPPCALCSACRDWNLGEFCPWDLTGIIGDISEDDQIVDDAIEIPVPDVASSSSLSLSKTQGMGGGGGASDSGLEEATTITRTSAADCVADVASFDGDNDAADMFMSVPQEISRSASQADFMSSMAEIEAWD